MLLRSGVVFEQRTIKTKNSHCCFLAKIDFKILYTVQFNETFIFQSIRWTLKFKHRPLMSLDLVEDLWLPENCLLEKGWDFKSVTYKNTHYIYNNLRTSI